MKHQAPTAPVRLAFGVDPFRPQRFSLRQARYDALACDIYALAAATIGRLLKPGGRAFIGAPIFLPPLHLARRHLVPAFDRLAGSRRVRTHVQAFTLAHLKAALLAHSGLRFVEARGLRFVSGGGLRPLEERRWWWAINRWLGARLPAACIEAQIVLEKPLEQPAAPEKSTG